MHSYLGEGHEGSVKGPVASGVRAADLALNVERTAEPTAIRRSISEPAASVDDISDSCDFCSGFVQHGDLSVAENDAVSLGPHHEIPLGRANDQAAAIRAQA